MLDAILDTGYSLSRKAGFRCAQLVMYFLRITIGEWHFLFVTLSLPKGGFFVRSRLKQKRKEPQSRNTAKRKGS
jgi:hypothetical protein